MNSIIDQQIQDSEMKPRIGQMVLVGTIGLGEISDFKDMFYDPTKYRVMEYENERKIGLFIPAWQDGQ